MRSNRLVLYIPVLLSASLLTGCGSNRVRTYPTSGRVVFSNGDPVRTGAIELESIDHKTTATGAIREDGSFVLGTYSSTDGAASGKHRVIVVQMVINDGTTKHHKDHGKAVPAKYARYETSGLTAEVHPVKQNELSLKIESASQN